MPKQTTIEGSEYSQSSFVGGMNLLGDDSRLEPNQYRAGFNLTNRYDVLDPVSKSVEDVAIPAGLKQEIVTFGEYIVVFIAGFAYYRHYLSTGWQLINGFKMSSDAPRFWTCPVPVAITNYVRYAATGTTNTGADPSGIIETAVVAGASTGNLPGLLVQDNINQPQFIFLDTTFRPVCRVTQSYSEWSITFTGNTNITVATNGDKREYVPIGNCMTWDDGVLYIVSQDFNRIYRSVSGRPLDFVINVSNKLVTAGPYTQTGGGDASTTAYDVGVGGITCIRQSAGEGIFVSASNANFIVAKNKAAGAQTMFGEYSLSRVFLFNANCLSDRVIIDTTGDTRFIDMYGIRSFNSISQTMNEGRNLPFSAKIQPIFGLESSTIVQSASSSAAILYNNYELYATNTILGPVICKYDTINSCWTSFDTLQTDGKAIKMFAKIELGVQRLFAITEDNRLFTCYAGPDSETASFRSIGVCANILYANTNVRLANPKNEVKLQKTRAILNKITEDCSCSFVPYVNNRRSKAGVIVKSVGYTASTSSLDETALQDEETTLKNLLFSTPNCEQGWKVFGKFTWTNGSFTQLSMELEDLTPINPLNSQ